MNLKNKHQLNYVFFYLYIRTVLKLFTKINAGNNKVCNFHIDSNKLTLIIHTHVCIIKSNLVVKNIKIQTY